MGGCRPFPDRPLAIRFRERTTETESKPGGRSGRLPRGPGLSRLGRYRCDRLEIRRIQRGAAGSLVEARGQQHLRDDAAPEYEGDGGRTETRRRDRTAVT